MNLGTELRSQFVVNLLFDDSKRGSAARTYLSLAGYDVFHFLDEEILFARVKESPPHFVFFEPGALVTEVPEFLSRLHSLNPDILAIAVLQSEQFEISQKTKWNVHDVIVSSSPFEEILLARLDHLSAALYLEYQNEDLIAEVETLQKALAQKKELVSKTLPESQLIQNFSFDAEFRLFRKAKTVDEILKTLFELNGKLGVHSAFFSFVPAAHHYAPLVFSHPEDQEKIRWNPSFDAVVNLPAHFPEAIARAVPEQKKVFHLSSVDHDIPYGFFLLWGSDKVYLDRAYLLTEHVDVFFKALAFAERARELHVIDPLTDLFLDSELMPNLEAELSRSRRNRTAVCLMKTSFDHLPEITQALGEGQRNLLLKTFAQILKTTGRLHDRAFRTGENEFTVILPDCDHPGAAVRAERLRQLVETSSFRMNGIQASISCGISDFPHFVMTAERLTETARESLNFIQARGGNKVCLYQPAPDFEPEYRP